MTHASYLPSVELLFWLENAEKLVAVAAKATLSPKSFDEITENMSMDDVEKWVRELVTRGHGSPLEHSIYVFEVVCSRVCSHQLVRHRHASYSQLSQRYSDKYLRSMLARACEILKLDYRDGFDYYIEVLLKLSSTPLSFEELLEVVREAFILPPVVIEKRDTGFLKTLIEATTAYYRALSNGVSYEDARYLLPQGVKTRLVVSMNARELVEVFLPLRMCTRAQWEIRYVAWELWKQLVSVHPEIFKYTGPRCVLTENRVRQNPCTLEEYLIGNCQFTVERCPEKVLKDSIPSCISSSLKKVIFQHISEFNSNAFQSS